MTPLPHLTSPNHFLETNSLSHRTALHVLTLTPFFPFASNPVYGTYISEPIHHFAEFNLRSTVIGVSPLHHERRQPLPTAAADWLRYPTIPGNFGLTTAGFFLYRRLLRVVRQLHQRHPIDIIHAHSALPCGHAACLLTEHLHIPFVVTIHGLDVFNVCFEPDTAAAARRAKVSTEIYRRAASVICISRAIQEILKNGMSQPPSIRVIYNGTDPQMFSPTESPAERSALMSGNNHSVNHAPTILIVGNLLRGKGHEVVLKAMARVTPQFPGLQCTVIGEGPDRSCFASLAQTLGIAEKVSFLGRQSRPAVAKAMRECTIFALPSRFEGLGCVYLEAMASAKPVIACEGQGIAEIIRHAHNGWLIPIDDIAKMTDALLQLLGSPDLRARFGTNARQTILNGLTLTDQVRQLNHLYRDITSRDAVKPAETKPDAIKPD